MKCILNERTQPKWRNEQSEEIRSGADRQYLYPLLESIPLSEIKHQTGIVYIPRPHHQKYSCCRDHEPIRLIVPCHDACSEWSIISEMTPDVADLILQIEHDSGKGLRLCEFVFKVCRSSPDTKGWLCLVGASRRMSTSGRLLGEIRLASGGGSHFPVRIHGPRRFPR